MNYTDDLFGKTTVIFVLPESEGRYNVTTTFQSNNVWNYTMGVYAQDLNLYLDWYGKTVKTSGYFVQLFGPYVLPSRNWTINILLFAHSQSSSFFTIELPAPVNLAILLTAAGFIMYINAFLLIDTHFKSKKEIISNKRWFLIIIVAVISALAIYQLYNFTTFILPRGV
jgi:hypothetical protein